MLRKLISHLAAVCVGIVIATSILQPDWKESRKVDRSSPPPPAIDRGLTAAPESPTAPRQAAGQAPDQASIESSAPAISGKKSDERNWGVHLYEQGGKWGFVNQDGGAHRAPEFDELWGFREGAAVFKNGSKFGFVASDGKLITPAIFDDAFSFHEGLAVVQQGSKFGFIDKTGAFRIPAIYDYAWNFEDGTALVELKSGQTKRYGLIAPDGRRVLEPIYDGIGQAREGLIRVRKDEKLGFADENGRLITPIHFGEASHFYDGLALVMLRDERFFIDRTGKRVRDLR